MKIPTTQSELTKFLCYIVEVCTRSQDERRSHYDRRRRYFLYGQNSNMMVRFNRLKSHLMLVCSFLYSQDGLAFSIAAPPNADDQTVAKFLSIEDDWNEEFRDVGLADIFDQALLWSIVLDCMFIKQGWNDRTDTQFATLVHPASIGVYEEDKFDFSSQEAFTHTFHIGYDDAVDRLIRAGRRDAIDKLAISGEESESALPETISAMIISATGGANLAGNITGEVNPDYTNTPTFIPYSGGPKVKFHEIYVWDGAAAEGEGDWRTFHMIDPDIIVSDSKETIKAMGQAAAEAMSNGKKGKNKTPQYDTDTNLFFKHEHPFTPVRPFDLFDYFWGDAHIESLIPLQDWQSERLEQIDEILQAQADPATSFTGFMGLDENKMNAWGGPGTWVSDQAPGAKAEAHPPQMPEDLFVEFNEIGGLFLEQSGLTEILTGRGERGVRGKGHARELQNTGGGRIRKTAVRLEAPLVRIASIGLRLKARNDDEHLSMEGGEEFTYAQVVGDEKFTMRVAAHSHSPLFTMETRELALILKQQGAIDNEWLVRLLNPTQRDNLIHALKRREKARAELLKAHPELAQQPAGRRKKGAQPGA